MPKNPTRRTAQITNVHSLWEILSPLLIRMRQADCGEPLPPVILKPIILQPGTAQAKVYRQHLLHPPLFSKAGYPLSGLGRIGTQLNNLRMAALCPHAASLGDVKSAATGPLRSWTDFNPKLAATLALVADLLNDGEQVLVGSPFTEYSDALHFRLCEAGVSALLLDGRTAPTQRGELVEGFKSGANAVCTAGLDAMGEGYNLANCRNLILPSLSWAMDINWQMIFRVRRLTSTKPITIYTLLLKRSIDERLYDSFAEKTTSAQLAIDRELSADPVEEVDLGKLLDASVNDFDPDAATLDENAMELQWSASLRSRLTGAEARYREWHPPIVPDKTGEMISKHAIAAATHALTNPTANPLSVELHRKRNKRGAKPVDWDDIDKILKKKL